jgi:glycosyltransferase involved in cell wall biosynthesis
MVPRVAIAHDYLTQRGGAERVALEMTRAFPGVPLYTTVYNAASTFEEFADVDVRVVPWLDRVGPVRRDPRLALPVLPLAIRRLGEIPADVVLCSSSGWSHGVRTQGKKVVYCHNPPRWLYQTDSYFSRVPSVLLPLVSGLLAPFRWWDVRAARSVSLYVANSANVAHRIAGVYGREATVVHPPQALAASGPPEPVPGVEPGYYLTVSRARGYKRSREVVRAFEHGNRRLVQVGGEPVHAPNVNQHWDLSDAQLRWLYANARALIAIGDEDFGLTPVESYAMGTPAIVLAAGGYLETAHPSATVEVTSTSPAALRAAFEDVESRHWSRDLIRAHAQKWSPSAFHQQLRDLVSAVASDEWPVCPPTTLCHRDLTG